MSAELALMNQILNKALKTNVDVDTKVAKIAIKTGTMAVNEGDRLQLDDTGLVYPPSAIDGDLNGGQVITSTNALATSSDGYLYYGAVQLDSTHYASVANSDLYIYEYDEANNIFSVKTVFDLGTVYNANCNYLNKVKDGILALHYNTDADSSFFRTVSYDSDYAVSSVYTSADLGCNSYSLKSAPIVLDDTRVMIIYYKSGQYYAVFELNDDGSVNSSVTAQTNSTLGLLGNGYTSFIDRTKSDIPDGYAYVAYNNYLVKISVQASTGTDLTFTDKTSETDEMMTLSALSYSSSHSYNGYYLPMLSAWKGVNSDTEFFVEKYGSIIKPIWDDSGNYTIKLYRPAPGQIINFSVLYNVSYSTRMVPVGDNKAYIYSTTNATVGYYSHNLYELTFDDDTETYTMELIAQKPFSHIETTSHGSGYTWMQLTDSGVLATNTKVYDGTDYFFESFLGTDNTNYVNYTKTKLIALSDVAADSEGLAYVDGEAFVADATASAGDTVLSKFKVTSTGYAVEKE